VVWTGGMYDFDSWAIPKGSPKKDEALKFIAFASQPGNQKIYSENIAYGPSNKQAVALIDKKVASDLPTTPANIKNQVKVDVGFWADYGESLEQRFNAWASK
jgi:putative spermidine/putrescine transport system substrate-binding protein